MRYAVWGIAAWLVLGALMNMNSSGKLTAKGYAKPARILIAGSLIGLACAVVLAFAGFDL